MGELLREVRAGAAGHRWRDESPLRIDRRHLAGRPARAAKIITDIVRLDKSPLRLLLGNGAVESFRQTSQARAAEAEKWVNLSRTADFPASR